MFTRILMAVVLALAAFVPERGAMARDRLSLIRDAEVENTIRAFGAPIFTAAGLDPESVRVILVNDTDLNAFVAGGMNLFINTGLLIRADHPGQVIGVIAHEAGHIAGGHLARLEEALRNATAESILAMVLGAAAGVASGRGDVAAAVMMGGQHMAGRGLLSYSRAQESAADQAAVRFLDSAGVSAKGLLEFMDILGDQEALLTSRQDPYVRTHPMTRDRSDFLRHHLEGSKLAEAPLPPAFVELHRRMRAKLYAFLEPSAQTFQRYREDDTSLEARYARAIALYRKPDMDKALVAIDALIAERPKDPYFRELKGQMLFENGRMKEALAAYREAVRLLPEQPLLRINLGQVETESNDPALLPKAQENLEFAVAHEPENSFAWRLLAVAYGRAGKEAMASYALANYNLLTRRLPEAIFHAGRAERSLPVGSPAWLRVQDVRNEAERLKEERKRD
ncbi:MAG: M48 family metallopeptidase [Alphaproteobacteria bacterium]|nr:M48 family metallopeptidase [Alphaproteobacteria bacterium]